MQVKKIRENVYVEKYFLQPLLELITSVTIATFVLIRNCAIP